MLSPRLDKIVKFNEPLSRHTSFRIGGPAEIFVEPRNVNELRYVLTEFGQTNKPLFVLGSGTNLLVADGGLCGIVICIRKGEFSSIEVIAERIVCGGGVALARVVRTAAECGLTGIEGLAGIPGTIGGAVMMNAGGKHGNIGESVLSVTTINAKDMTTTQDDVQLRRYERADMRFGYRWSCFRKSSAQCLPIILKVELQLEKGNSREIQARMDSILRAKKESQPMSAKSAGCIFKNPSGKSAGRLIDEAGLKGYAIGNAVVSSKHANFIVNRGNASADDVLQLINVVIEKVRQVHGIELELEIEIWKNAQ